MGDKKVIRILLAKAGLDVHDIALRQIARLLRDAGMEVVYLGIHQSPESIVNAAIHEDVDLIGLSSHCGIHLPAMKETMDLLNQRGASEIPVVIGGVIPAQDRPILKKLNTKGIFGPGTSIEKIVRCIEDVVAQD